MISKLEEESKTLVEDIANYKNDIDNYNKTLSALSINIDTEAGYYNLYKSYLSKEQELQSAKQIVDNYHKKSSKALEAMDSINGYKEEINRLSAELDPVMKDMSVISGQLTLLDSYYAEYNEYKSSYDIIETLKKYCSPTGGGIQTLFM
jgi:uncharacterized coiled-coil DUF342 family protein